MNIEGNYEILDRGLDQLDPKVVYCLCKPGQVSQNDVGWLNNRQKAAYAGQISASRAGPFVGHGNHSATQAYKIATKQKDDTPSDFALRIMEYGRRMEPVANERFIQLCRPEADILEFGLIPNQLNADPNLLPDPEKWRFPGIEEEFLKSVGCFVDAEYSERPLNVAGSPDGASSGQVGIMQDGNIVRFRESSFAIEIKCPSKRKFVGDIIPGWYIVQMQVVMHCMGLHSCVFIQFQPKSSPQGERMTITEVLRDDAWWANHAAPALWKWSGLIANFNRLKDEHGIEYALEQQPPECVRAPRRKRRTLAMREAAKKQKAEKQS